MSTDGRAAPEQLPFLSRGKHRSPRKGACFMELASYLAGERWSDHPSCTHPLLAVVARAVNDATSDEARPRLAVLVPSVIGLHSDDVCVDARIALRCAATVLPAATSDRQRILAVGVLTCERVLDELEGRQPGSLDGASVAVLDQVPHAAEWARDFTAGHRTSLRGFRRHAAPRIVNLAAAGAAEAPIPDPDRLLYDLLAAAIAACRDHLGGGGPAMVEPDRRDWERVCALTGTVAPG